MTASFMDLNTIANDNSFMGRCLYALETAAINVMAEDAGTANHTDRVNFARNILGGNINPRNIAFAVLTNSTIAAEATTSSLPGCTDVPDGDIQFAVNSLFNALAGVST